MAKTFEMKFQNVYIDKPFHDDNWVLLRVRKNKEHWNTIILDGTVPDEEIKGMIEESYELVK